MPTLPHELASGLKPHSGIGAGNDVYLAAQVLAKRFVVTPQHSSSHINPSSTIDGLGTRDCLPDPATGIGQTPEPPPMVTGCDAEPPGPKRFRKNDESRCDGLEEFGIRWAGPNPRMQLQEVPSPSVSWSEIRSEKAFLKHFENGVVGFDRGAGNGWRTPPRRRTTSLEDGHLRGATLRKAEVEIVLGIAYRHLHGEATPECPVRRRWIVRCR